MTGNLRFRMRDHVRSLPLGAFAFVMATGIVLVGMSQIGLTLAAWIMLCVAALVIVRLTSQPIGPADMN